MSMAIYSSRDPSYEETRIRGGINFPLKSFRGNSRTVHDPMLDDRQRVSFQQTRLIRRFVVSFQRVSPENSRWPNRQVR